MINQHLKSKLAQLCLVEMLLQRVHQSANVPLLWRLNAVEQGPHVNAPTNRREKGRPFPLRFVE